MHHYLGLLNKKANWLNGKSPQPIDVGMNMLSHNEFWPHKYFNKKFFIKIFSYKDLNHTQEYFFYQYTDN